MENKVFYSLVPGIIAYTRQEAINLIEGRSDIKSGIFSTDEDSWNGRLLTEDGKTFDVVEGCIKGVSAT